jgi:hypothetical protein
MDEENLILGRGASKLTSKDKTGQALRALFPLSAEDGVAAVVVSFSSTGDDYFKSF